MTKYFLPENLAGTLSAIGSCASIIALIIVLAYIDSSGSTLIPPKHVIILLASFIVFQLIVLSISIKQNVRIKNSSDAEIKKITVDFENKNQQLQDEKDAEILRMKQEHEQEMQLLKEEIDHLKSTFITLNKQAKLVEALPSISKGFSKLHELRRKAKKINDLSLEDKNRDITFFCSQMAEGFSTLTGVQCAICIKGYFGNDKDKEKHTIRTLFRDSSNDRHIAIDKQLVPINENTSFLHIVKTLGKKDCCFFENNLPKLDVYTNSSFPIYTNDTLSFRGYGSEFSHKQREESWGLPYKSTIKVPIKINYTDNKLNSPILGFLCLDAPETNVFDKNSHVELLNVMASRLYNTLEDYLGGLASYSYMLSADNKKVSGLQ